MKNYIHKKSTFVHYLGMFDGHTLICGTEIQMTFNRQGRVTSKWPQYTMFERDLVTCHKCKLGLSKRFDNVK